MYPYREVDIGAGQLTCHHPVSKYLSVRECGHRRDCQPYVVCASSRDDQVMVTPTVITLFSSFCPLFFSSFEINLLFPRWPHNNRLSTQSLVFYIKSDFKDTWVPPLRFCPWRQSLDMHHSFHLTLCAFFCFSLLVPCFIVSAVRYF